MGYNNDFTETLKAGTAGNKAHFPIFYEDDNSVIVRLGEAEGHDLAFNPEVQTVNPIDQEAEEDIVKSQNESFAKDIIIKYGAPNYEFFSKWLRRRPTGDNAKLRIYMADMSKYVTGTTHHKYLAYTYMATVTVESANYADGKLAVNFKQAGNLETGIIQRVDTGGEIEYGFTPSSEIAVTGVKLGDSAVTVKAGKERKVSVEFSPLGAPQDFLAEADDDEICSAVVMDGYVLIKGLKAGTNTIAVSSVSSGSIDDLISVTVSV